LTSDVGGGGELGDGHGAANAKARDKSQAVLVTQCREQRGGTRRFCTRSRSMLLSQDSPRSRGSSCSSLRHSPGTPLPGVPAGYDQAQADLPARYQYPDLDSLSIRHPARPEHIPSLTADSTTCFLCPELTIFFERVLQE